MSAAVFSTFDYVRSLNDRLVLLVAVLVLVQICATLEYRSPKAAINKFELVVAHVVTAERAGRHIWQGLGGRRFCFACRRRAFRKARIDMID